MTNLLCCSVFLCKYLFTFVNLLNERSDFIYELNISQGSIEYFLSSLLYPYTQACVRGVSSNLFLKLLISVVSTMERKRRGRRGELEMMDGEKKNAGEIRERGMGKD